MHEEDIAPKPHIHAAEILTRIEDEAPPMSVWPENTGGKPEHETLHTFCRTHFIPKRRAEALPGDALLFRMSPREAARTAGVLGEEGYFTFALPGRKELQTVLLDHFWRSRLIAAFTVPVSFLAPVPMAAE